MLPVLGAQQMSPFFIFLSQIQSTGRLLSPKVTRSPVSVNWRCPVPHWQCVRNQVLCSPDTEHRVRSWLHGGSLIFAQGAGSNGRVAAPLPSVPANLRNENSNRLPCPRSSHLSSGHGKCRVQEREQVSWPSGIPHLHLSLLPISRVPPLPNFQSVSSQYYLSRCPFWSARV